MRFMVRLVFIIALMTIVNVSIAKQVSVCIDESAKQTAIENAKKNPIFEFGKKFNTKFAPNTYRRPLFPISTKGMTAPEKIDFYAQLGFTAYENNDLMWLDEKAQKEIITAVKRNNMTFGVFTAHHGIRDKYWWTLNIVPNSKTPDKAKALELTKKEIQIACKLANEAGSKWITVVPGYADERYPNFDIFCNVLDHLKVASKICEKAGVIMVLEPLCHINHPGLWLKTTSQAFALCEAVNSPSCKILFDVYHQQTEEGNLYRNISEHIKHIAYFHIGDVPNRTEPGSGEINYKNLMKYIRSLGYEGVFGMEHGLSATDEEGELNLMKNYRQIDTN